MSDPTFTAPPTAPNTSAPTFFSARMDTFLAWFQTDYTELTAFVTWCAAQVVTIVASAAAALASQIAAAASAAQSQAASGVSIWVTGTTYAVGDCRFSPLNFQTYRRKTAGAGATDPSLDTTNWQLITALVSPWQTKTGTYTLVAGDRIRVDTSSAAFTLTTPASPADGDYFYLQDITGSFASKPPTLGRNGHNIMGIASDMTLSVPNLTYKFEYDLALTDWRLA